MLIKESNLKVVDNSGAKLARCIKIAGKKKVAGVGDIILVTLRNFFNRKKVKKRALYLGLIVAVRYWMKRLDGLYFRFFSNRILIFNKQYKFLGTRVYGAITKEIRIKNNREKNKKRNFQKIISYAPLII